MLKFYVVGFLWVLVLLFVFCGVVWGPSILLAPEGLFPPPGTPHLTGNEVRIPARPLHGNLVRAVLIVEEESAQSGPFEIDRIIRSGYVFDRGKRYAIKWGMIASGREDPAKEIFLGSPVGASRTFRAGFFLGASTGALPQDVLRAIRNGSCQLVVAVDEMSFFVCPIEVQPE